MPTPPPPELFPGRWTFNELTHCWQCAGSTETVTAEAVAEMVAALEALHARRRVREEAADDVLLLVRIQEEEARARARAADRSLGIPSYTCPLCSTVSYNPGDLAHRYCARCNVFEADRIGQAGGNF